jgi:hypothetical protein
MMRAMKRFATRVVDKIAERTAQRASNDIANIRHEVNLLRLDTILKSAPKATPPRQLFADSLGGTQRDCVAQVVLGIRRVSSAKVQASRTSPAEGEDLGSEALHVHRNGSSGTADKHNIHSTVGGHPLRRPIPAGEMVEGVAKDTLSENNDCQWNDHPLPPGPRAAYHC